MVIKSVIIVVLLIGSLWMPLFLFPAPDATPPDDATPSDTTPPNAATPHDGPTPASERP